MLNKCMLFFIPLLAVSLANPRYKAAHTYFDGKSWSPALIITLVVLALAGVGLLIYWYLKSRKDK